MKDVDDLITSVNQALERRRLRLENHEFQKKLEAANTGLERRVEERTAALRQANDELLMAKKLAEAANISRSNFIMSMSHELRTPLNSIIGFSDLLRDTYFGELNEKQAEYVADIHKGGKHLLFLVNNILDITSIETGEMTIRASPVYVNDLLEDSVTMIQDKVKKQRLSLDVRIHEALSGVIVEADEPKLKQVLFNLLINAIMFTPEGGSIRVEGKVIPELRNSGIEELRNSPIPNPSIQISIADTGIGIAPDDQEKIFDAFYQVAAGLSNKTPGTGLGLTLAKQIVEMHGGRIWVESKGEGEGSRFSFVLPVG